MPWLGRSGDQDEDLSGAGWKCPKVIRHAKRADGSLEATVSDGGQRAETFVFRRTP